MTKSVKLHILTQESFGNSVFTCIHQIHQLLVKTQKWKFLSYLILLHPFFNRGHFGYFKILSLLPEYVFQ